MLRSYSFQLYRIILSPILKSMFGAGCRYQPTCSSYADLAIARFGIIKGGVLTARRISRCHPFYKAASIYDPLPENV
jgi:uncharacterized protein